MDGVVDVCGGNIRSGFVDEAGSISSCRCWQCVAGVRDLFEEIHSFLVRRARGGEGDGEKFVACCADRIVVLVPLVQGRDWYPLGVANGENVKSEALVNRG